jgi:hypothetical protein
VTSNPGPDDPARKEKHVTGRCVFLSTEFNSYQVEV